MSLDMQRRWLRNLVLVLILSVIAGAIFGAYRYFIGDSSLHTGNTFVGALIDGNSDKTYKMLAAKTQQITAKGSWDSIVAGIHDSFGNQTPQYVETSKTKDSVVISYNVPRSDSSGINVFTVVLIPNGGLGTHWQVTNFTSSQ